MDVDGLLPAEPVHTKEISGGMMFLNVLAAKLWIGPLVVLYWASTWMLCLTELIYPSNVYASVWISFAIAHIFYFIGSCFQAQFHKFANLRGVFMFFIVSRLFTYIMAFASVNQWRSVWIGMNVYTSTDNANGVITALIAYLIMVGIGCSKQLLVAPTVIDIDVPSSTYFYTTTYFTTQPGSNNHVFDSLFSSLIPPILKVFVWRGFWNICDNQLSPGDVVLSATYSIVISLSLTIVLLMTQEYWVQSSSNLGPRHWAFKYIIEDAYILLQAIASISYWRGVWYLFLEIPLDDLTKYWIGHGASFILLMLTFACQSLPDTGCALDGRLPDGRGIVLDINYISNLKFYFKRSRYNTLEEEEHHSTALASSDPTQTTANMQKESSTQERNELNSPSKTNYGLIE